MLPWARPSRFAMQVFPCETAGWTGRLMRARSGMEMDADIASLFDLSPAEKLQLVQDLWDDLAANPENVPFYTWQEEEVERRRANLEAHPESALTWDEVKQRTRARHGR
jgi:putative addiction module component (TIGR02574 family)